MQDTLTSSREVSGLCPYNVRVAVTVIQFNIRSFADETLLVYAEVNRALTVSLGMGLCGGAMQ